MTVQELIDFLNSVDNKDLNVAINIPDIVNGGCMDEFDIFAENVTDFVRLSTL